ncbi:MAG: carbohydrate kinase family protein, partial [bacterium]|nr:carbohydrate kinase family protein [bacterium]
DHESLNDGVVSFVKENNVKLGFNPGTYQIKKGLEILKPVMAVTFAFIVNKLEAGRILGIQVKQEERDDNGLKALLLGIHNLGVKNVVITDGPIGTYAYDGKDYYYLKPNDVPVVERTGTGDAFSTGFMGALIEEKPIEQAMMWGAVNSESVLQFIGAREGLLTKEKIIKKLSEYKNFNPEKI